MKTRCAIVGWFACLLVLANLLLAAEAIGQDAKTTTKALSPATQKIPIDWALLVKSLRSSNSEPKLQGGYATFAPGYDDAEQERIRKTVHILLLCAEDAWDELLKNASAPDYSLTIEIGAGASNMTVGHVCERIVRDTLHAQYQSLIEGFRFSDIEFPNLVNPALREKKDLLAWLNARRGVSVRGLQAELAQDILKQMRGGQLKADEKFVAALERVVKNLKLDGYAHTSPKLFINRETSMYVRERDTGPTFAPPRAP